MNTLWIDGVGGFGLWETASIELGRSIDREHGLSILGDLPGRAVRLKHHGEDWLIEPIGRTLRNNELVEATALLQHGDRLKLGDTVELVFEQANPWSSTAALKLLSRHRWSEGLDGVLLLGQTCLLGASPKAHVRCRDWSDDWIVYRSRDAWMVQPSMTTRADSIGSRDTNAQERAVPLTVGKRLQISDCSLTLM